MRNFAVIKYFFLCQHLLKKNIQSILVVHIFTFIHKCESLATVVTSSTRKVKGMSHSSLINKCTKGDL